MEDYHYQREQQRMQKREKSEKDAKRDRILIGFIIAFTILSIILAAMLISMSIKETSKNSSNKKNTAEGESEEISDEEAQKIIRDSLLKYSTNENVNQEQLADLAELCETEKDALPIIENFDAYPERVIKMILFNKETMEFLLNYPDKINQPVDENIDISKDYEKADGDVPLFIQWDQRWGYYPYGSGVIAYTACGPTCLSMVYTYLTKDLTYNPLKMTQYSNDNDYYEQGVGTRWTLMTKGASALGISSKQLSKSEENMKAELEQNHPIIASMGPGDFTDNGHFMVIKGYENGCFLVNDPNSIKNSDSQWSYEEIKDQIKALWAFWK